MNKQKKLTLERNIFVFILVIIFAYIITQEKTKEIFTPKVEKLFNNYINETYKIEKNNWKYGKVTYNNKTFKMKVISKDNKNLYFYLIHKNKKITDTYKKDYLEGNTLLTHINKNITKEINNITNKKNTIIISTKLNNYSNTVKDKLLNEDKLINLRFYTIENELLIDNFTIDEILNQIIYNINLYESNNITPKNYTFIITNKNDITKSIKIDNITYEFINNPNQKQIISAIISNEESIYLTQSKITYKYLN